MWVILDGGKHIATGCPERDAGPAQQFLADYITRKYQPQRKVRAVDAIAVADVLMIYVNDIGAKNSDPKKFAARIRRLGAFWGARTLGDVSAETCRAYESERGASASARRELEDLRAAINHHEKQGFHREIVKVTLPAKGASRDRWLTREEAARMIWACWRHREVQTIHRGAMKGIQVETAKRPLKHIARFILIALYTGTRAGAVSTASPNRMEGRSYVDLDAGVFHRLAIGKAVTNKRQPPVRLPNRLLAHLRRWARLEPGMGHFVEFRGKPVKSIKTGFRRVLEVAAIDGEDGKVMPHTFRHTAATWLMQQGTPVWEAAGFLGMSEKTLRDVYGHHHPDFQIQAAEALGYGRVVSLAQSLARHEAAKEKMKEKLGGPTRTRTWNQIVMSESVCRKTRRKPPQTPPVFQ